MGVRVILIKISDRGKTQNILWYLHFLWNFILNFIKPHICFLRVRHCYRRAVVHLEVDIYTCLKEKITYFDKVVITLVISRGYHVPLTLNLLHGRWLPGGICNISSHSTVLEKGSKMHFGSVVCMNYTSICNVLLLNHCVRIVDIGFYDLDFIKNLAIKIVLPLLNFLCIVQ